MNFGSSSGSESASETGGEFAKLLESYVGEMRPGKVVPATVVEIGPEVVAVDIGGKSEGIIPVEQFKAADGSIKFQPGDKISVMILMAENEYGQVVVSKEKADQFRVWKEVEQAFEKGTLVSGKVIQKVKGGLQVDIGIPAFLPGSQIDIRPHRNLDKFLMQDMDFKILKISRDKGNIVLSRRAVLTDERDALRTKTLEVLAEGVVIEGVVKNITDYGAFIDLGGIDGLLHITDISWGRVNHPSEKLNIGQTVPVVVLKYDQANQRVSLGMKQLREDPWQNVESRFPVGKKVSAKIINITDYGAFAELEEGLDGLIHISDMSWTKKVRHPSKLISTGDVVEAIVLGIDIEQQKISLGMKQATTNPWLTFADRHPTGTKVKGTVRSIKDFGIFVGVEDGIDGLVHVSDFSWTKRVKDPKEIQDLFKKGDEVEAVVLEVDVQNERLSLGIKQLSQDPWDALSKRYPVGSKVKGTVSSVADFGVFVEIEEGVEGLIHVTQLDIEKGADPRAAYEVGKQIDCEVTNVDNDERRISLSVKAIHRRQAQSEMEGYMQDSNSPVTFGDLIREQLEKK